MLSIQYFASIRETLGRGEEELDLPAGVKSVQLLIDYLLDTNPHFEAVFNKDRQVLVAVNQTVVGRSHPITNGDEVAFFPPMTGG